MPTQTQPETPYTLAYHATQTKTHLPPTQREHHPQKGEMDPSEKEREAEEQGDRWCKNGGETVELIAHGRGMTRSEDQEGVSPSPDQACGRRLWERTPVARQRRTRGLDHTTAASQVAGRRRAFLRRRTAANRLPETQVNKLFNNGERSGAAIKRIRSDKHMGQI